MSTCTTCPANMCMEQGLGDCSIRTIMGAKAALLKTCSVSRGKFKLLLIQFTEEKNSKQFRCNMKTFVSCSEKSLVLLPPPLRSVCESRLLDGDAAPGNSKYHSAFICLGSESFFHMKIKQLVVCEAAMTHRIFDH